VKRKSWPIAGLEGFSEEIVRGDTPDPIMPRKVDDRPCAMTCLISWNLYQSVDKPTT
jgi:hypothetical protein